jgi:hypothetical protein
MKARKSTRIDSGESVIRAPALLCCPNAAATAVTAVEGEGGGSATTRVVEVGVFGGVGVGGCRLGQRKCAVVLYRPEAADQTTLRLLFVSTGIHTYYKPRK